MGMCGLPSAYSFFGDSRDVQRRKVECFKILAPLLPRHLMYVLNEGPENKTAVWALRNRREKPFIVGLRSKHR
jgi:hypothetical protein